MGRRAAPAGDDQGREPRGTRAALVEGAIETLREAGFAGASARQIARRANCNQALVFYHFGSVHDLLLAALEDISARRLSAYRGRLENAATLTDLIDGARSVLALFDRASVLAALIDLTGGLTTPSTQPGER